MDAFKQLELANVKVYKNAKETGLLLGMGSFGSVVELTIKGEGKFAGKKIHEVLIIDGDASILVKECKLMSELSHPNIAKFCGVCRLPSRSAPVLVMELMDNSLEDFLENKAFHLALTTAISILMDIANGLAYLHGRTPRVLHRDLTARNVLLDRYTNAKITDFGNSRIIDVVTRVGKTMTQAPGTSVYMPPEALDSHSTYSDRLDVFSFGHLALYALMRQFPKDLLPTTYITPKGDVVARTELDRRSKYMDCLSVKLPEQDHQLYQLVEQCLQNDPTKRPDACKLLAILQKSLCLQYGDLYTKTAPEPVENAASKSSDEVYTIGAQDKISLRCSVIFVELHFQLGYTNKGNKSKLLGCTTTSYRQLLCTLFYLLP